MSTVQTSGTPRPSQPGRVKMGLRSARESGASGSLGGKTFEVTFGFRVPVLRNRSLCENAYDAFRRKVELNESDAAIEGFAVMRDQPIALAKAANTLKEDGPPGGFRQQRGVAEPKTRITD